MCENGDLSSHSPFSFSPSFSLVLSPSSLDAPRRLKPSKTGQTHHSETENFEFTADYLTGGRHLGVTSHSSNTARYSEIVSPLH